MPSHKYSREANRNAINRRRQKLNETAQEIGCSNWSEVETKVLKGEITMTKFSEYIYETPDDWGETTVADKPHIQKTIKSLRELGEDWKNCSADDCTELRFIAEVNGKAVYETLHVRHPEYRVFTQANGFYAQVESLDAANDTEAIAQAREI